MQLLTQNCQLKTLPERLSRMTFVVFNYDRCVEQFLFYGLQNYYGINQSEAAELLSHLTIFHPYGSVGKLPWQSGNTVVEFGGEPSASQLLQLADAIKTFTEGTDPSASDVQTIRSRLSESHTLLFLGFAFHTMNLDLLTSTPHSNPDQVKYFGTAYGMSDNDCRLVRGDLMKLAGAPPDAIMLRNDLKCGSFLREYWRSLSLT